MNKDREKWNSRFENKPMLPPSAPGFIAEQANQLMPGSVLDIASGDGAASLFLAKQGFAVTSTDLSIVALRRLSYFAKDLGIEISTYEGDLECPSDYSNLGTFDNIVMTHFKPSPKYWPLFSPLINPGGKLLISTFNTQQHLNKGFAKRFCLEENELCDISEDFILEHYGSSTRNGDFMDDYRFRRA